MAEHEVKYKITVEGNGEDALKKFKKSTAEVNEEFKLLRQNNKTLRETAILADMAGKSMMDQVTTFAKYKDSATAFAQATKTLAVGSNLELGINVATSAAQGAVAAYQGYAGALSLLGIESKSAESAMQSMMAAMSVAQSITGVFTALQKEGNLILGGKVLIMRLLGIETNKTAAAERGAAVASKVHSTAVKGTTAALTGARVAAIALRGVLVSLGIGAIVWGITALLDKVSQWKSENEQITRENEKQKTFLESMVGSYRTMEEAQNNIEASKLRSAKTEADAMIQLLRQQATLEETKGNKAAAKKLREEADKWELKSKDVEISEAQRVYNEAVKTDENVSQKRKAAQKLWTMAIKAKDKTYSYNPEEMNFLKMARKQYPDLVGEYELPDTDVLDKALVGEDGLLAQEKVTKEAVAAAKTNLEAAKIGKQTAATTQEIRKLEDAKKGREKLEREKEKLVNTAPKTFIVSFNAPLYSVENQTIYDFNEEEVKTLLSNLVVNTAANISARGSQIV